LKAYKTLAEPVLSNGREAWIITKQDERCLTSAEVKFLRKTVDCSLLDHKRNESITYYIKITRITEYLQKYRRNWLQHLNQIERSRLPRRMLHYVPKGARSKGRSTKRWWETAVTGKEEEEDDDDDIIL
jgi:hypothetical protein